MTTELGNDYNRTKLGLVPNYWKEVLFENLFSEVVEYTNDTTRYPLYSLTIENGVTPKIGRYERSFLIKKSDDNYKVVKKDEFVYNPMNLRFGALSRLREDKNVAVSGYYNVFRVKSGYSPQFIEYYLKSERMMYLYNAFAIGSLKEKKRVHFSQFVQFKLPIPPQSEANKIAIILSTWDKAIELKEKLIGQKKEQKNGLLQKLLIEKEEWKQVKFNDITIGKGKYGLNASGVRKNEQLPTYLRITDISDDGYIFMDGLQSVDHPDSNKYYLNENDIVFARTGASTGKSYLYKKSDGQLVFAGFLIKFSLDTSKVVPDFIKYWVQTRYYQNWVKVMSMRSGQPGINAEEYGQFTIKLPSKDEQFKISKVFISLDKEILLIEKEIEALKQQKQGLMQKLLTGKVRVKV